jgi:DNA-binding HxlR family transcriptional regulator
VNDDTRALGEHPGQQGPIQPHGGEQVEVKLLVPRGIVESGEAARRRRRAAQRYSDLEKVIPGISQKMLAQQLRQLEADGIVVRKLYPQVPPKVEYRLTEWGQALCPALDGLLKWSEQRDSFAKQPASRRRPSP